MTERTGILFIKIVYESEFQGGGKFESGIYRYVNEDKYYNIAL